MAQYNHTQSTAATTWTINHNLNSSVVAVDVMINNGPNLEKILPADVQHTNNNTLTVIFSAAQTGKARIVTTN